MLGFKRNNPVNEGSSKIHTRVVWKWEDEESDGERVGPVWVDTLHEGQSNPLKTERWEKWARRSEAEAYAKKSGFEFLADE